VEGLRDCALGWSEIDVKGTTTFVSDLLHSDIEMLRRVGLYLLQQTLGPVRRAVPLALSAPVYLRLGTCMSFTGYYRAGLGNSLRTSRAATIKAIREIPRSLAEGRRKEPFAPLSVPVAFQQSRRRDYEPAACVYRRN